VNEWKYKPLGLLGKVTTGSTPKSSERAFYGGDVPFVTPAELDLPGAVTHADRSLSDLGVRKARILPAGSVMVCCIGSLGKVGIAGRTVATNQQINSIVFDPEQITPRFGLYACRRLKPKLQSMAPATTVAIVSKSKFEQLEIPVPPLQYQRRVVEVLGRAEDLRAKRREALAHLDDLTKSIFLDSFGDKRSPQISKIALGDILVSRAGTVDPSAFPEECFDLYSIPAYDRGTPEVPLGKDIGSTKQIVQQGDVLLSKIVPHIRRSWIVEQSRGRRMIASGEWIVFRSSAIDPLYLRHALLSDRFHAEFMSTVSGVGGSLLRARPAFVAKIRIPLPSIGLQEEFARRVRAVQAVRAIQQASLGESDRLFASMEDRAFRGLL
jgi:type I restriction enzyme S subunit